MTTPIPSPLARPCWSSQVNPGGEWATNSFSPSSQSKIQKRIASGLKYDLLNPSKSLEAQLHVSRWRCFQSGWPIRPSRRRPLIFRCVWSTEKEETSARPQLLLHGRKVPWMLQHHHRLFTRSNRRHLRIMPNRPVPANRW